MKVVQINSVCDYGSTGRIAAELSEYLTGRSIENIIIYADGVSSRKNALKFGNKLDHKVHALMSRITGMQGYFSRHSTEKMLKYLEDFKPDIIHLHNLHANYINLQLLFEYAAHNNIAVVITLHDCFFFTGKCVHYSMADCARWKCSCGSCPQLKNGNVSWGADKTAKMLSDKRKWYGNIKKLGVIGVSKWITDEARQSVLSQAAMLETIYNWIDLDVFKPHASDILDKLNIADKHVILGVSIKWSEAKGIDDFNRLADLLDNNYKIILVGKSETQMNSKILHIPMTQDVYMLSDLYAAADLFYNPTRGETFGKVTAEALACGTPVIAYNTTACPELVPKQCGYIEPVGDVRAVAEDIYKITESGRDYSEQCRKFAEKNFDKVSGLEKTVNLYKELMVR